MIDLYCWEKKFKPCKYSNRLLSKLLFLNARAKEPIDIAEIKKAIYYAKKYHGLQMRQSGEPYYSHPIEVAYQIADYKFTTDVLVTSILHDILEDTMLTRDALACIFCSTIANNVEDLTRVKSDRKISAAETMQSLYLQNKHELLLIKIFDRLHNLQTISAKLPEKIKKITKETLKDFMAINMELSRLFPGMLEIEEQITKICYQHLAMKKYLTRAQHMLFEDNFQLFSPNFQNDEDLQNMLYLVG